MQARTHARTHTHSEPHIRMPVNVSQLSTQKKASAGTPKIGIWITLFRLYSSLSFLPPLTSFKNASRFIKKEHVMDEWGPFKESANIILLFTACLHVCKLIKLHNET